VGATRPRRRRGDRAGDRRAAPGAAGDDPPRAEGGPTLLRRLRRRRDPHRTPAGPTHDDPGDPVSALIDTVTLQQQLHHPELVVLDVQFTLTGDGPDLYADGHLPGAPFVDLDTVLAGEPGTGGR